MIYTLPYKFLVENKYPMTINKIYNILANSNGYELLKNSLDYEIRSSARRTPPVEITGSPSRTIHIELYTDLFSSERFLEVSMSAQIVLSGLQIDTKRSMALKQFSIQYARGEIQNPGEMTAIMVR